MNTGVPNPIINITDPVRTPHGENYQPNWRLVSQYLNALNTTLQAIIPIHSRVITESQTQQVGDYAILVDVTYGDVVLTLLPASTSPPYQIFVKLVAGTTGNTLTIQASANDFIDAQPAVVFTKSSVVGDLPGLVLLSAGNNIISIVSQPQ